MPPAKQTDHVEQVELHGHIIDSLLLPKVLDEVLTRGGSYVIKDIRLGQRQVDPSFVRLEVRAEADFYGAMDGSSKFVRGDAIAGILILLINIIGGLAIGTIGHGMAVGDAAHTYTLLTIGDGLVTVIPALMISISGGLIVTRASADTRLGAQFQQQVFGKSEPLMLASGVLLTLALETGRPS